ncbi:MAG: protein BatD [Candidatus Omnitrophica bacterium]|nr:protein BatD [Candidatus Omnitrophota bacterium]
MRRFVLLFTLSILIIPANAFAEVAIETSVSRSRVSVGEELTLDITITNAQGKISRPVISSVDGFTSYSQSHSQEISIVNGVSSSKSVFSYALVANSPGQKTIGPFEINIDGRVYKVAPVKIEVVPNAATPQLVPISSGLPVSSPPARALPAGNVGDRDIFVKAWLDRDEVFVNEPAMLTYTLYTRLSATYKGFEKEPETTGFWVEDFPPEKTIRRTEKILNGSRYVVADVRKLALFPTEPGVFTVDPGTLAAVVELRSQDDFDSYFSSNVFGRRNFPSPFASQIISQTLSTENVALTAKALPEAGRPAGFSGAVGDYQIESSLDKDQAQAGDPVTFRLRIWGQGNISTLQMPALPGLEDFKVYDSATSTNVAKNRLIVEGEKITETAIVPKKAGTYTIPAVSFYFFDPRARVYKEIKTAERTLRVTAAPEGEREASSEPGGVRPVEKEDVAFVAKDIRYLKARNEGRVWPELFKNPFYWGFAILMLVLALAWGASAGRKETALGDRKIFRLRRSHSLARKKLKAAEVFLKENRDEAFYAEMDSALRGYFADRLDISPQAVSLETIESRVADGDADPEMLNRIKTILGELSGSRFGSVKKDKEEMKDLCESAGRVIDRFEKVRLK